MSIASRFHSLLAGAALALTLAVPMQASAAVLYSNPWEGTPWGWQADDGVGAWSTTAALSGPVTVSSISWWGYYGTAGSTADDLFTVSLDGNDLLGSVAASAVGTVQHPDLASEFAVYRYTLALASALSYAGGVLEIGIVNGDGNSALEWFWLDAGTDPGSMPDVLPSSLVIEGDRTVTEVPEPGSLALLLGAGGLLALTRRRTGAGTRA